MDMGGHKEAQLLAEILLDKFGKYREKFGSAIDDFYMTPLFTPYG